MINDENPLPAVCFIKKTKGDRFMNKKIMYIITILSTAVLLFLDQIAKYLAVLHLKGQAAIPIIKNVFELQYLENQGAAFGIMQGKKTFFVIGTLIFLVIVIILYHNIPLTKRFTPIRIVAVLIVAGAIGNMIDRVFRGYVIDFFYFSLIDFPVFNVADCYVTVSVIIFIILILFVYKNEDDFAFLSLKK